MRSLFAIIAAASMLFGCRPSHPASSLTFGDGDAILKSVLDSALSGYDTQFPKIGWSGGGGGGEFAVDHSFIVKNANIATIGSKLFDELNKLPAKRGWDSHGSGIGGYSGYYHVEISYEEGGAQFYFDFVLIQQGPDVKILILHKGVQR